MPERQVRAEETGNGRAAAGRLRRLVPRTYGSDVAASLRGAILNGTLRSGEPLVERRIAEDLGVSRAPVREALRRLEEEGLVVTFPYKGTYVRQVTPRTVDEILSLRTVLEGFAAERALPRLAEGGGGRLHQLLADMSQAARASDEDTLVELHMAFHRTFYELGDHSLLMQFWMIMETQMRLYDRVHQQAYPSLDHYVQAHAPIAELVSTGELAVLRRRLPSLKRALVSHITEKVDELLPRQRP
jgi:DNA-binding GntR family transcriptional regulator